MLHTRYSVQTKTQHKQNKLTSKRANTKQLLVLNPLERKDQIEEPNRTHETPPPEIQPKDVFSCFLTCPHSFEMEKPIYQVQYKDDNSCVLSSYIITRPHALGQFTRTFLQTEMRGFLRTNLHHSRVGGKSWCGSQLRVSCLVYLTMTTILDNFVLHSIDLVIMYVWHFGKGLQNLFNLKVGLYNIQYLRYTYNIVLRTYLSFLR